MKECDIIIPVWNQPEVTRDCVDSILKNMDLPYRLVIIDNGSGPETQSYLNGLRDKNNLNLLLIRNDENRGFVKAVNQGLKEVIGAPYVCIMNNDTIATAGWLSEMMEIMKADPRIGFVNPSSNTSGQSPKKNESIDDYAASLKRFKGKAQELYTCRGFCMLIRREVVDKLGPLDEIYDLGYFEETDYCRRAQQAGFRIVRAKAAYVFHRENTSFKELKGNKILFERNEKIFFKRWGRPIRIAYFVDKISSGDKIDAIATDVARNGHQILIFLKKGLQWPVNLDHFDIRRFDLHPLFFGMISIYKIFKRKNRKRLEMLLTDNRLFGIVLKGLGILHGSDVLINPNREELLKLLKEKSKYF